MATKSKKKAPVPLEPLKVGPLTYSAPSEELLREVANPRITVGARRGPTPKFPVYGGKVQVVVTAWVSVEGLHEVQQLDPVFLSKLSEEVLVGIEGLKQDTLSTRTVQALGCTWVNEIKDNALSGYFYNITDRSEDGVPTALEYTRRGWRDLSSIRWHPTPEEACVEWAKRKLDRLKRESEQAQEEINDTLKSWEAIGMLDLLVPPQEAATPEVPAPLEFPDTIQVWSRVGLEVEYKYDEYPGRLPARSYLRASIQPHPYLPGAIHWVGGAWKIEPRSKGSSSLYALLDDYLVEHGTTLKRVADEFFEVGTIPADAKASRNLEASKECLALRQGLAVKEVPRG